MPAPAAISRRGDRLVRLGAGVFGLGLAFVAAAVMAFLFGYGNAPLAVNLLALTAPLGLGLALAGLLRQGRDGQRRVAARLREWGPGEDEPVQR